MLHDRADMQETPTAVSRRSSAGFLSSAKAFFLPPGSQWSPDGLRGYYVDFTVKASDPSWPEAWRRNPQAQLHVWLIQHALGCYERYLAGQGDRWMDSVLETARFLLAERERTGRHEGAWFHRQPFPHTYRLPAPWISAMAQGQGASLLTRCYTETGDENYLEAALLALRPLEIPVHDGGVRAELGGAPFAEEYPTIPGSYVLNGAIFTLWGVRDVALASGQDLGLDVWVRGIADNLARWDLGYWSRYDLYPHPIPNPASSFYHLLHVTQLKQTASWSVDPRFGKYARIFDGYLNSRWRRGLAFAGKAAFRIVIPRNRLISRHLPWTR